MTSQSASRAVGGHCDDTGRQWVVSVLYSGGAIDQSTKNLSLSSSLPSRTPSLIPRNPVGCCAQYLITAWSALCASSGMISCCWPWGEPVEQPRDGCSSSVGLVAVVRSARESGAGGGTVTALLPWPSIVAEPSGENNLILGIIAS